METVTAKLLEAPIEYADALTKGNGRRRDQRQGRPVLQGFIGNHEQISF